jgi:hypothetical protein
MDMPAMIATRRRDATGRFGLFGPIALMMRFSQPEDKVSGIFLSFIA